MLDRLAIYGVPALAGAVTAAVLLGPGGERDVVGARVWGLCTEGARQCALRVQTVVHYAGAYLSYLQPELELTVFQDGRPIGRWRGASSAGGLAEALVSFDEPVRGGEMAVTVTGAGETMAEARAPLLSPLPVHPLGALVSNQELTVRVPRGTTAPPFPETVEVLARTPLSEEAPTIDAQSSGAEVRVLGKPARSCDAEHCEHRWQLEVSVSAPAAELALDIDHAGGKIRWSGALPVHNGAIWLDPASLGSEAIALRAPSPRSQAFLSVLTEEGRIWGAIVEMKTDLSGVSTGEVALPASLRALDQAATLVASSGASAQAGAVGWPLRPEHGTVPPAPLVQLADGLPPRVAAEEARRSEARRPAYGLVLAAGLFELLFLWRRNRIARATLERHLRAASAGRDDPDLAKVSGSMPLMWLTVLAGALALAFAILAAVAAWA